MNLIYPIIQIIIIVFTLFALKKSYESENGFGKIDYYPNQVMYLCADISDLIEDTGFKPRFSFEEGIKNILSNRHFI